jgi:RND family efflux transporter MFP subunit
MRSRAAILLLLSAASTGCGDQAQRATTPDQEPIPITLADVERRTVERTEALTGTLHGVAEVRLSALVSGRVLRLAADLGDRVPPGTIVAELDATEYQLAYRQREAALAETLAHLGVQHPPSADFDLMRVPAVERARRLLEQAESRLARGREYRQLETPVISGEQLDDLATAVEVARTDLEREQLLAQARLAEVKTREAELRVAGHRVAECTIHAPALPASGGDAATGAWEVATRFVEAGEFVAAATPLFDLVLCDDVILRASLPERLLARVQPGAAVTIRTESDPGPFQGTVDRIAPAVDERTRTFRLEARFPNQHGRLRPGAFARGEILVGREAGVLLVPAPALVQFAGVEKIFTVRDARAVEHVVTSGVRRDDWIEIRGELPEVQQVVVGGAARLADGIPVRPD